jgi:cytochrome c nitrite reductase small subunit
MSRRRIATSTLLIVLIGWATIVVMVYGAMVAVTDRPQFCVVCHEMHPFYDAWKQGPHQGIWCIDCHTDTDVASRVFHKVPVMKQVLYHVLNKGQYPLAEEPDVPNERCLRCHESLAKPTASGFQHTLHSGHRCMECHAFAGHTVTVAALREVGAYSGNAFPAQPAAAVGNGAANVVNHKQVVCSNCHDMGSMGCSACHTPHHKTDAHYGTDCTRCHQAGARFVFYHPKALPCGECHSPPKDHGSGRDCTSCHYRPGVTWAASHPGTPIKSCDACHVIPPDHDEATMQVCSGCHKRPGITWAVSN